MTCPCCQQARDYPTVAMQHVTTCLQCGARLIQLIKRYELAASETQARCKAVAADWIAAGHDEATLRELAKRTELATDGLASSMVCVRRMWAK